MKNEMNEIEKYYVDILKFMRGLTRDEHLAEELTQETFLKAMKNADSYRGEAELRVWLCSIAKNTYYTYLKRDKKENTDIDEIEISDEKLLINSMEDRQDRGYIAV